MNIITTKSKTTLAKWLIGCNILFIGFGLSHATLADNKNIQEDQKVAVHMPANTTASISKSPNAFTLAELTELALNHHPTTQAAWAQFKSATAAVGIAKSSYWPKLSATVSGGRENDRSTKNQRLNADQTIVDIGDNVFTTTNRSFYNANISLNYLLLDFGTRNNKVAAAEYNMAATNLLRNSNAQQVILQVEQAYYQLLGFKAVVAARKIGIKQAKASLDAAEALHKQGLATIGDVYQAKSTFAKSELDLEQANGDLSTAQGQLNSAIGLPIQTKVQVADLPEQIVTRHISESISQLLETAKQQRPDLQAAQAQVSAAKAQLAATKGQAWPTLQLSTGTGYTHTANGPDLNQSNVLLTVNIPLFTGFEQTYAENQAQAQVELAQANQHVLENQIDMQVWQAYFALQTASKTISSSESFLKSSEVAAKQALGQYRADVGNILSVLTTEATENLARTQYIQAKLNWYIALGRLSAAMGTLGANNS